MSQHLAPYLVVCGMVFAIGMIGFIVRRNLIVMFLTTELMFQAVILAAAAVGRFRADPLEGQAFGWMLIAVAAAEAAVGLALVIVVFRRRQTLNADTLNELKSLETR